MMQVLRVRKNNVHRLGLHHHRGIVIEKLKRVMPSINLPSISIGYELRDAYVNNNNSR